MTAKRSALAGLHTALADLMLHELEFYRQEGIPMPAADKAAIAKFLKDNAITCDPAASDDLEELRRQLEGKREGNVTRLRTKLELAKGDVAALYGA
jgi:hypothetical protein